MAADLDFFSPQNIKSKNDKAIRNLSQSIKRVIPFVGAGISKACGLPKWDELLDQLALNHFSPSNRKKINKNDVFSYADSIYSIFSNHIGLNQEICELFDSPDYSKCSYLELFDKFPSKRIITTNYDLCLEHVCTNLESFYGIDDKRWNPAVDAIFHIHGSVEAPDTIILCTEAYNRIYGEKDDGMMAESLREFFSQNIVLFVGCGLNADRTLNVLANSIKSSNPRNKNHYAIVELPNDIDKRYELNNRLTDLGIRPIYYLEGNYEEVGNILRRIIDSPKTIKADSKVESKAESKAESKTDSKPKEEINKSIVKSVEISTSGKTSEIKSNESFLGNHQNRYLDPFVLKCRNTTKKDTVQDLIGLFLRDETDSNKCVKLSEIYTFIENEVLSGNSSSITVKGLQGTGKSTLITLMYQYVMERFEDTNLFPFIIDLHANPKVSFSSMKADIRAMDQFSKTHDYKFIVFVDGIDEKRLVEDSFVEREIKKFIDKHSEMSFVYCVTQVTNSDSSYINGIQSELRSFYTNSQKKYGMHRVRVHDNSDLDEVVRAMSKTLRASPSKRIADSVVKLLRRYELRKVDFRTLLILVNTEHIEEDTSDKKLGQILYEHYLNHFSNKVAVMNKIAIATASLTQAELLDSVSNKPTKEISSIIQKNSITRSLFIALYLINLLKASNHDGFIVYIKNQPVLNSITNCLFDDLYRSICSEKEKNLINKSLISIISSKRDSLIIAQAAHMLARINSYSSSDNADDNGVQSILIEKWNNLHKKYFKENLLKVNDIKAYKTIYKDLVLFRTISVSLLINGCSDDENNSYEDDFLECILQNDLFNSINRGFHIAYFDEQLYDKTNNRYLDAESLRINESMAILFQTISEEKRKTISHQGCIAGDYVNPLIGLNVLTVLTLYQSRVGTADVVDRYKQQIEDLLNDILTGQISVPDIVKQYASSQFLDDDGKFDAYKCGGIKKDILSNIFILKQERMKGWNDNGNEVGNEIIDAKSGLYPARAESVCDHTYGAYLIARFFLPDCVYNWTIEKKTIESYINGGYDKQKILRMLLIHDFGKCKTGDQVYGKQEPDYLTKQKETIDTYKYSRSVRGVFGLDLLYEDWVDYHCVESLNKELANEINAIEMYVTAIFYSSREDAKINLSLWNKYLEKKVTSPLGKSILTEVETALIDLFF